LLLKTTRCFGPGKKFSFLYNKKLKIAHAGKGGLWGGMGKTTKYLLLRTIPSEHQNEVRLPNFLGRRTKRKPKATNT
jgi:hypothetical protein